MWQPGELGIVVAERELTLETPQGVRSVIIVIGKPVQAPNPVTEAPWWCPFMIKGLLDQLRSIAGEDSLQALVLTLEFVGMALPELAERAGGRVQWLDNDLDCVTPTRSLVDAYSRTSAEALELVRRLTEALDSGDVEMVQSVRHEIEAMRLRCHL